MNVRVLGPLEASVEGQPLHVGAGKPRALFAILALQVGEMVSTERLIEGLWGEHPPASATKLVQVYVSQLRKALAASGDGSAIVTRGRGYELHLAPEDVDLGRFEQLVAQGAPREALALWRGPPLGDVSAEPFAAAAIRRLEELRLAALELAIDADLEAGRHREVLGELDALVTEEPLRERLHAQRMLALYRSGRQADALAAYRQARRALVEQIGIEPGPELRRLHEAILNQEAALEAPAAEPAELPPELDAGTPLLGREPDLDWLRELWRGAHAGAGRLVLVTGGPGIGKTRLAAELAAEVHRDRAPVLYASGAGAPAIALAALERARAARPTLIVLDDLDGAGEDVHAALDALRAELARRPAMVLATARESGVRADATLRLGPLDAEGVRAVAALYRAGDAPAERLLAESGGVPRRVHSAAREWARAEAARRLGHATGRAASERAELRAAEDEVAVGVEELQAVPGGEPEIVACPFKGLASFDVDDVGVFFGRERLVAELVARLAGAPLMAIVGPSGSGKSSALRAGLLAALAAGVLPGSERWAIELLRPGERPLRALEHATAGTGGRSVVAVDQFEELFTACRDEAERAAFADALAELARGRTLVLVAIRADFYGHCAAYPALSRLMGANHVLVGPMRRDELRRAIELPARRAGLRVEPELVDALVADVADEPGALPLLSSSLLELWQRRDGRRLRLSAYEHAGGVRGAVARLAERAYEQLDGERREVARAILLRLAEGEGDAVVRRRVPLAELEGDDVDETLSVLADERLVTVSEGEVEVAHEALLREWPRLRGWLEEDAEGRRLHTHLIAAARNWHAGGRDAGELYRGARLAATLDWAAAHERELNETERAFLEASRARAEREAERQRSANRRLRALLGSLAALLALSVVAGVAAISQRGEARDAALAADAQRLGAQALTEDRLDRALLLARAGVALDDSAATRSSLLAVLQRRPAALGVIRGDGPPLLPVAVSPDEKLLAIGDQDGLVTFLDAATHRPLRRYRLRDGLVQELAFSPDGAMLAVSGHEPQNEPPGALVDLVDARTGERRRRIVMPPFPEKSFWIVLSTLWMPNGDLVVQQTHNAFPDGPPSVIWSVDGRTGELRKARQRVGRASTFDLSATRDGRVFATNARDRAIFEFDPDTLEVVPRYDEGDDVGAVSPDGRMFALGSAAGHVRLLDLRTREVRRLDGGHSAPINVMRFTPDGRTLVTSGSDGDVIAWDVAGGGIRETFSGHRDGQIWGLAVSSDGRTVYSAALDGRMIKWDLAGDRRLGRPFAATRPYTGLEDPYPVGLAHDPSGATLAMTELDGTVSLLDTRTLERRAGPQALDGAAAGVDFSPDGRMLAVSGERGQVRLLDARTGRSVGELRGLRNLSQEVEFSPDGTLLAGGQNSEEGPGVMIWDVRRRAPTGVRFGTGSASVSFSPDGKLLAAAFADEGAHVRDPRTGKLVARLRLPDRVRSVEFSPAGGLLAVGTYDGKVQLFSSETWKSLGSPVELHTGRLLSMSFSRDGLLLATASDDGTATLFDVSARKPVGSPITVDPDAFVSAALAPDGAHLFAVSTEARGLRWDVSPALWSRRACDVAGRELTPEEWRDALPDRPYRAVCGGG